MNITIIFFLLIIAVLSFWKMREWPVFLFLLFCCFVLMGYNIQNPDYYNYYLRFARASYPDGGSFLSYLDISDTCFQAFCKQIGIKKYEDYRLIQSAIIFAFFGWFAYKQCYYRNVFLFSYIICYLLRDIINIRNFAAFVVLLPFFSFLAKRTLTSIPLYICGVLISATIHFSMLFFLLFVLIGLKSLRTKVGLSLLFLLIMIPLSSSLSSLYSSSSVADRVGNYDQASALGGWMGLVYILTNYIFISIIISVSSKNNVIGRRGTKIISVSSNNNVIRNRGSNLLFDNIIFKEINLLLFIFIPFFFINASIGRIFRFVSILNSIFILNTIYYMKDSQKKVILMVSYLLYVTFFAFRYVFHIPEVLNLIYHNSLLRSI